MKHKGMSPPTLKGEPKQMIKGKKKPAQEVDPDTPEESTEESEPITPSTLSGHQEVDRATLKALFAEYEEAEGAVAEAKQEVEEALRERSAALQKIVDHAGSGPYKVDGQMVKIVKRGDTLFLRGKGKEEAIEV